MRQRDAEIAGASAFFALGVLTVVGSAQLGIGTATQPGPGFFASGIGALMALLSTLTLVSAVRKRTADTPTISFPNLPAVVALMVAMAAYGLLVERAGFAATTLVFMIAAQAIAARSLPRLRQAVIAVVATAAVYLVFQTLLRSGLPSGSWWG